MKIFLKAFVALIAASFSASFSASAQISIEFDGDSELITVDEDTDRIELNDRRFFDFGENGSAAQILGLGFGAAVIDAELSVDTPGTFTFDFIGGFDRDGVSVLTLDNQNAFVSGNSFTNTEVGSLFTDGLVIEEAGEVSRSDIGFQNFVDRYFDPWNVGADPLSTIEKIDSDHVAVFIPDSNSLTGLNQVIFAFEGSPSDRSSGGPDFDEQVILATFTPLGAGGNTGTTGTVPEPPMVALMLAGLAGIAWRSRRRKSQALAA